MRIIGLKSVPYSKNITFGVDDVYQLIHLVSDHPPSSSSASSLAAYRLPKLQSIFASRACRSAVMIGDALDPLRMKQIVSHMSEMDQPWNCPHGRPTMRHLFDVNLLQSQLRPKASAASTRQTTSTAADTSAGRTTTEATTKCGDINM